MGICAHATGARGGEIRDLGDGSPFGVEERVGFIAFEPCLESRQMLGLLSDLGERHLMRAPCALHSKAINDFGTRPPLGRTQDDHRPGRPFERTTAARLSLAGSYLVENGVER